MGFWDTIKSVGSSIYNGAKTAIRNAASWVAKQLEDKPKTYERVNYDYTPSHMSSEEEEKARIKEHNKAISDYQKRIAKRTDKREKQIQSAYKGAYIEVIDELERSGIDVADIRLFIDTKAISFENVMRDEVNTKVSPSYYEWKSLIDNVDSTQKDMDKYTKKVYDEAENKLLDLLEVAYAETNEFIKQRTDKYLTDKSNALQTMKESLVNLTKDKESQERELQKIAVEYTTMLLIEHEAEKEI